MYKVPHNELASHPASIKTCDSVVPMVPVMLSVAFTSRVKDGFVVY